MAQKTKKSVQSHRVDPKRSRAAKKAAVTRALNRELRKKSQLRLHHKILAGGAITLVILLTIIGIRDQLIAFAASTNFSSFVGLSNKCLDDRSSIAKDWNTVQLYHCNGTNAQKWTLSSDGSIHSGVNSGFCLDVMHGVKVAGTRVQLYHCNQTNAQKFTVSNNRISNTVSGLCVGVKNGSSTDSTPLVMQPCQNVQSQKWAYGGSTSSTDTGSTTTNSGTPTTVTTPPPVASSGTVGGTITTGQKLFVSPTGNDSNSGDSQNAPLKTLAKAQTVARTKNGNLTIYLAGGTYSLTSPLTFSASDSGRNGTITWSAQPGSTYPLISGGSEITGWTKGANGIWSAKVPSGTNFRELYVNDSWATRARSASGSGYAITSSGVTAPSAVASYANPTDMEIVASNSWKVFRCGVSGVHGTTLTIDSKCWSNAHLTTYGIESMMYLENALELLDSPGEWYLNTATSTVYYMPRSGETMNSTPVVYPIAQQLITGSGVSNVTFTGIRFAHTGYNATSSTTGYTSSQAAAYQTGSGLAIMPAAVSFSGSKNISFTNDVFKEMGSAALMLTGGSQASTVTGNTFRDLGSAGIQLGGINSPNAVGASQDTGFTVTDNYIHNIGIEYPDAAAIFTGYVANTNISHNEIGTVPYTGISMGWGWGTNSFAQNNTVSNNYIHDFMQVLGDGGAIYTLSSQPNSKITGNYALRGTNNNCLYPDQGSANMTWSSNVCINVPQWLHIWTSSITNLTVSNNFADTSSQQQAGTHITMSNNTIFTRGSTPPNGAQSIMNASGLESPYLSIRSN